METRRSVVVVEEGLALAENLSEILEMLGHDVRIVSTAEDALAELDWRSADLILVDWQAPSGSGARLAAKLRSRGSSIPVVAAVAFADEETATSALAGGATEILREPLDLSRLLAVIRSLPDGRV